MADLADIAAATTAGYRQVTLDRGAGSGRFEVTLEKALTGGRRSAVLVVAEVAGFGRDLAVMDVHRVYGTDPWAESH